jgi:8-oxo-dGTP diphosphatase
VHWRPRLIGAAAAVFDEAGRVLLVRHTYGRFNWELPGGASEPGETFAETALRELKEETGLLGEAKSLVAVYYKQEDDSHHVVFRCEVSDGVAPTPSSPEISACSFWPPSELPRPISDFTVQRIEQAAAATRGLELVVVAPLRWLE